MKAKLVFENSLGERGLARNTFTKNIDVELPDGIEMAHLVSAVCYDPSQGSDVNRPVMDTYANIWDYDDESRLIGKLLTYVDATYTDKEQREAHKNLVKDMVYGYFSEVRTRANQLAQFESK